MLSEPRTSRAGMGLAAEEAREIADAAPPGPPTTPAGHMYATRVDALSPEKLALWAELNERGSPELGPLLHPGYAQAVAAVRPDVEVGLITDGDEVVGFLPFQRTALDIGRPVGDRLCDQSGAVVREGASWCPLEFAKGAQLRAIRLSNCHTLDPSMARFQTELHTSMVIDLSGGFDAYIHANRDSGSKLMRQMGQRMRKAEREVGPIRFEWHTEDDSVLERLLHWKSDQRRDTCSPNILDVGWARALIEKLRSPGDGSFGGLLSAVYFGERLVAAHMGIRTRRVLHYWIPAYDPSFSQYSPGLVCLLEVARAAAEEKGIVRIELGVGEQRFKVRTCTGATSLATATVTNGGPLGAAFRAADGLRGWSRGSKVGQVVRATRRVVKRGSYMARSLLG